MMIGVVNKIIPFSSVDGPGNRTAVFLQGCNFNCQYCHNPETINHCIHCGYCVRHCPTGALTIAEGRVQYDPSKCCMCDACFTHCRNGGSARVREMTADEVMAVVKKQMPFIRGITVSGGECTLQRDFLVELLTKARAAGLHTLVDTNGSYDFAKDPELLAAADGVMLDVKAWNGGEHFRLTGEFNDVVLDNLRRLAQLGKLTEVRTVVVPELFDCEETIRNVSALLRETDSLRTRYKIICYRPNGVRQQYRHLKSPSVDTLQGLAAIAAEYGLTDVVIV